MTPRIAAALTLTQLLKQQGSLATLLPQHTQHFNDQDNRFIQELCYGCCRWYPLLEQLLSQLLKQGLKKKDSDIKALLLLGLYQLQFLNTADYAAINESVNAAIFFKKPWAKKLINAVLRQYQRDQQNLFLQAQKEQKIAHPRWLEKKIQQAWPVNASAVFDANNQHPPLALRINQQQLSRDTYLTVLKDKAIEAKKAPYSQQGIYIEKPVPVTNLPLFIEGAASVQDEAAQLAASLLDLKPGLRVLDACCAPGGKTCHIAESESNLKQLVALDVEERRLQKVQDNLKRLKLAADIHCADATQPKQWWDGQFFDRILLDAPCSATGIIRRQPDIKLLRTPEHIEQLTELQLQLLQALWPLLVEGGILLYATCSILPEENTELVERFAQQQSDAIHEYIDADWGLPQTYGRQLLPTDKGHDGFFYAKLKKKDKEA